MASKLDTIMADLAKVKKNIKTHLEMYKTAEGDQAKKAAVQMLKKLNAEKKQLDKKLDQIVSQVGKGASLDKIQKMTEIRELIKQVIKETLNKS
mgnify:FL=1